MTQPRDFDEIELVTQRATLLEHLVEVTERKPELVDSLDVSRSTVDRAIGALEAETLVERTRDGYQTTTAGRIAASRYRQFTAEQESILAAREFLEAVPPTVAVPIELVTEARIETADPAAELFSLLSDRLPSAGRVRALLPELSDTRILRLYHAVTIRSDLHAELVVDPSLRARLETEFPRLSAELVVYGDVDVLEADLSFGLVLLDAPADEADVQDELLLIAYENGEIRGLAATKADDAVAWGVDCYEQRHADRTVCTDRLRGSSRSDPFSRLTGDRLPAQLRSEGFRRIGAGSLEHREPLSPTTAWRAGLGLPEVAAGYDVARAPVDPPTSGGDPIESADATGRESHSEKEPHRLAGQVLERLTAGTDCVLVGPPGSGKSTVAKRVAVDWVDDGHGEVLYRESGMGQSVESVALLSDLLERTAAPLLVVVEDAVRPDASAVLELIREHSGRDDVVFLCDAREREWTSPEAIHADARLQAYCQERIEPIAMPGLDEQARADIVTQVEQQLGETVPAPADTLLADDRRSTGGSEDDPPGSMLLLFDRLARVFDPRPIDERTDTPARLDEEIDRSREALADVGRPALDVGLIVHLLNAADVALHPALLYARATATTTAPDSDLVQSVREAIDRLEGTVLFRSPEGPYRTIHRMWSVRFLARSIDADERATRRRFERCVTALLDLAADPDRRAAAARVSGDSDGIAVIDAAPADWADETAARLFDCIREHAQLTALFDPDAHEPVALPEICSPETTLRQLERVATCRRTAGDLERSRQTFERLGAAADEYGGTLGRRYRIESLLGRGDLARRQSAYDEARRLLGTALELAEDLSLRRLKARCRFQLGVLARSTESFDEAIARFEHCRETFEVLGETKREADAYRRLGEVRAMQAELSYGTPAAFDAALDDLDASLTRYQSIGDRRGQADARRWLGQVRAIRPDADPVAACREHRVVVDIARQLGDVDREARALYALGDARFAADELSRAREQFERALSLFAEEDRLAWTIIVRRRLAIIAVLCGAFDRARDRLETALSDVRTIDRPEMESRVHRALAVVYCYTHDLSRAADHARDSLKLARTLDDGTRIVRACQSLGRAQLHAGAVDAAETTATRLRAAERAYDVDGASAALCARVALARGDHATARNHATCGLDGPEPEGRYQIVLGRIALATGALDEARDYCTDTVQDQYGDEHRYWTQHALVDRARAHRHAGAFDAAATDLQAALDSTDVDPYPLPAARVTLQRGALARARGSLDRAQTLLDRAQDRCETLDTPRLVARTQFERGLLTAARGDIETAHDLLRTAADRCRDLGARAQEARMLAALIDLGPALDGDDLDRYRTRYETLDCEHVPVCHDQCDVTPQPSP